MKEAITMLALLGCGLLGGFLFASRSAPIVHTKVVYTTPAVTNPSASPFAESAPATPIDAPPAKPAATVIEKPIEKIQVEKKEIAPTTPAPEILLSPTNVLALKGRVISNLDIDVKCKVSGQIQSLAVEVGDYVEKGQVIAVLDPVDEERSLRRFELAVQSSQTRLEQARQSLLIGEQSLRISKTKLDANLRVQEVKAQRAKQRLDRMVGPLQKQYLSKEEYDDSQAESTMATALLDGMKAQHDDLKTQEMALSLKQQDIRLAEVQLEVDRLSLNNAQQRLKDTRLIAPASGFVTYKYVQEGSVIISGTSTQSTRIVTLSDLSRLFVLVPVDSTLVGRITPDALAEIRCDAFPGELFEGRVTRVAPRGTASPSGVTFEVRIEVLGNHGNLLKPEMPTTINLKLGEKS